VSEVKTLSLAEICRKLGVTEERVKEIAANVDGFYGTFSLKKRRGGKRKIAASQGDLKFVQRGFLQKVLSAFHMPPHVHGCVKRRSAATNAEPHVGREIVIKIDLESFYDSIGFAQVRRVLEKYIGIDAESAEVLAEMCTFQSSLPAGAPTSPALANLVLLEMDRQIMERLPPGIPYTRYLDDVTISGGREIIALMPQIADIVERNGFRINDRKTRILRKSTRQSVTGVVVNEGMHPPKVLTRRVRQYLYYCRRWGIQEHAETHAVGSQTMIATLRGMIGYVGMIDPLTAVPMHLEMNRLIWSNAETREEALLDLIQDVIDAENVLAFTYDNARREVAPSEIFVSNGRYPTMRGWQTKPSAGWRVFLLSEMSDVEVVTVPDEAE
jgi:hypothetical protein